MQRLRLVWPRWPRESIERAFPGRTWELIGVKASRLRLKRKLVSSIAVSRKRRSTDPMVTIMAERREQMGLTQDALAKRMKVSNTTISLYERARRTTWNPSLKFLRKWCDALDMEMIIRPKGQAEVLREQPSWFDAMEIIDGRVVIEGLVSERIPRRHMDLFQALGPDWMSRDQLIHLLYGDTDEHCNEKIIDVLICQLRKKIRCVGLIIENSWGEGWRLQYSRPSRPVTLKAVA